MRDLRPYLLVLLTGLGVVRCGSADPPRPNIVLIHVDDLGWHDLSVQGSAFYETPHIDALAAEGLRFTHAYAAASICSPSRAAILTGRAPARLHITDWIRARFQGGVDPPDARNPTGYERDSTRMLLTPQVAHHLELEEQTLAELLKTAGYATAHVGKWHLGTESWYPGPQGFDENHGGCDYGQPPSYFDPYERAGQGGIPTLTPRRSGEYLTDREADEAVDFIRRNRDHPFFLYLAHYAVHTPIQAKDSLTSKYTARAAGDSTLNAAYAAMIESVDHAVRDVWEVIRELDLTERTVVIFTSDNGGLERVTDNAPLREGKGSPYEGGIRVPSIVVWPGLTTPGSVSDEPVIGMDYFATVADVLGLDPALELDGVSLRPVLTGTGELPERALFWHYPHYRYTQYSPYSIARDGRWKLIRHDDPEAFGVDAIELFDLEDDPAETRNVAGEHADVAARLEGAIDDWLDAMGAQRVAPNPEYVKTASSDAGPTGG